MVSRRCLLVLATVAILLPQAVQAQTQTIGQKMATFLEGQKGKRQGGGECAHLAMEALRVGGGEFIRNDIGSDSPGQGDYVWGTLVTVIEVKNGKVTDSKPTSKAQPGDVIQYRNVVIKVSGGTNSFSQHTSVIAAVNSGGRPTQVYQQNLTFNGVNTRVVRKDDLNLSMMTSGWVRIYRPKARLDKTGQYKFTLVNLTPGQVKYSVKSGTFEISSFTLGVNNTAASYVGAWYTISGTNRPNIVLTNGATVPIDNAAAYEVYATSNGVISVRKRP